MKTPEDFQINALVYDIHYWHVQNCVICRSSVGYVFGGDEVRWSGCRCSDSDVGGSRSWKHMHLMYKFLMNIVPPGDRQQINEHWHFDLEVNVLN